MMLFTKPMQWAACVCCGVYYRTAFRVRVFGTLPRNPGPSLLIANHQHEMESPAIIATQVLAAWTWRRPFFTVSSRRMWEPGFFAERIPWLKPFLRDVNLGWLFEAVGMQPIENELHSRPFASIAFALTRLHGDLPVQAVFKQRAIERITGITTIAQILEPRNFDVARTYFSLSDLLEPYRAELLAATREQLEHDIAHFEDLVRGGATIFLTPEGFYTTTGKMQRFRGILERLTPIARSYIAAVSYDPFVGRRLSMLYRVREKAPGYALEADIKRARAVTTSALLASWLNDRREPFQSEQAVDAVAGAMRELPSDAFVDPELAADCPAMTRKALEGLVRLGALRRSDGGYRMGEMLVHPQFPNCGDMIAYQANFHAETLEGLRAK